MLYTVIGLTIPVLGGLVRYKILGFLLLLISLVMIFDKKRIKNKICKVNQILSIDYGLKRTGLVC